jgi:hypothetical protein
MAKEITDVNEVTSLMKGKTPVVIFFYMTGCPHCIRTMPVWNDVASKKLPYTFAQVESEHVPVGSGITGFPHFMARHADGTTTVSDGSKASASEIESSLNLKPKLGGRRRNKRRTTRVRSRRSTRRIRKRTN